MLWLWLPLALFLGGCADYPPGTPLNHPLLWAVGLSASFCLLAVGIFMVQGMLRRWERRAERRE